MKGIWKVVCMMFVIAGFGAGIYTACTFDHDSGVFIDVFWSYAGPVVLLGFSLFLGYHLCKRW